MLHDFREHHGIILQKSFKYADLVLKIHFILLSVLKIAVLIVIRYWVFQVPKLWQNNSKNIELAHITYVPFQEMFSPFFFLLHERKNVKRFETTWGWVKEQWVNSSLKWSVCSAVGRNICDILLSSLSYHSTKMNLFIRRLKRAGLSEAVAILQLKCCHKPNPSIYKIKMRLCETEKTKK